MKLTDELTGLYTRRGFFRRVERLLKEKDSIQYVMISFHIKNFKFVNAIYGVNEGDALLSKVGESLRKKEWPNQVSGRMESDHFAVFLPSIYGKEMIDFIEAMELQLNDKDNYPIYIDVGVYTVTDRDIPPSLMYDRANIARSSIADNMMEKVAFFDEEQYSEMLHEQELCFQLPEALRNSEFFMLLQPQVDTEEHVVGGEALVRWDHPQQGVLAPNEFVPCFEKNHMIVEVDKAVWEMACKQLRDWKDNGHENLYIAVNVSPTDFECIDVYQTLMSDVKKYDIDSENLRVEITESSIMKNPAEQIKLIKRLRQAGFYVEMDDFGSGYSSFSMLKDIETDAVKLDMGFLGEPSQTTQEDRAKKILTAIVNLVKECSMRVVAEGVESKEQEEFLKAIGCDVFQGYYFGKPMRVREFEQML
jgi:diguanylate cyclase (GGDEF)-like protein